MFSWFFSFFRSTVTVSWSLGLHLSLWTCKKLFFIFYMQTTEGEGRDGGAYFLCVLEVLMPQETLVNIWDGAWIVNFFLLDYVQIQWSSVIQPFKSSSDPSLRICLCHSFCTEDCRPVEKYKWHASESLEF